MELISEILVDDILEPMESRVKRFVEDCNNLNTVVYWNNNKGLVAVYSGYDENFHMEFYTVKLFTKSEEKIIKLYESKKSLIERTARLIIDAVI